jgi:hypothetical protein
MNDNLKKAAQKLVGIIPHEGNAQSTWENFSALMSHQKDYFLKYTPLEMVILFVYIWSLQISKDPTTGDKILNRLFFACLFEKGNPYQKDCETCDGSGEVSCEHCYKGTITCDECDGSGEVDCPECDGDGRQMGDGHWEDCEICEGSGKVECKDCGGRGETDCEYCDSGDVSCDTCDGSGVEESNDYEYDLKLIVSWNTEIKNRCEITNGNLEPTMSEYDFDRLRDKYVILSNTEDHEDFVDDIEEGEIYCAEYGDLIPLRVVPTTRKFMIKGNYDISPFTN